MTLPRDLFPACLGASLVIHLGIFLFAPAPPKPPPVYVDLTMPFQPGAGLGGFKGPGQKPSVPGPLKPAKGKTAPKAPPAAPKPAAPPKAPAPKAAPAKPAPPAKNPFAAPEKPKPLAPPPPPAPPKPTPPPPSAPPAPKPAPSAPHPLTPPSPRGGEGQGEGATQSSKPGPGGPGSGPGGGGGATILALPKLLNAAQIADSLRRYYPESERRAGREGTVIAYLNIGVDGRVDGLRIMRSAGPPFDAAASRVAHLMLFSPARGPLGPIPVTIAQSFVFKLTN